jgi:DNA-binding NarL/FixJ family response regulator
MGDIMPQPIRVLIADDRPSSRRGLRALLGVRSQIEIVGEAADGRQAVQMVEELQPDVVLMDVSMPVLDGLEATQRIKCRWPEVRVVVLTMYAAPRSDALAAGADNFLVKGCQTEDLLRAISGDMSQTTSGPQQSYCKNQEGTRGSSPPTARAWCLL